MNVKKFDVIVLGVGGMGSAACYYLASRGARVLGIEQFNLAHDKGSSHGKVRLIRRAYFEHPNYVPLLNRSYELWKDLEKISARSLLHQTGLLLMGSETTSKLIPASEASARQYDIPVEKLDHAELVSRYPQFNPPEDFGGLFEPGAGYLEVENSVDAFCRQAAEKGAEIHFHERVARWTAGDTGVMVKTDRARYEASNLLICAGAWSAQLLEDLELPLTVRRVPQFWFDAGPKYSERAATPCFAFEMPYAFVYGFPQIDGQGMKIADHTPRQVVENASALDLQVYPEDSAHVKACLTQCFPGVVTEPTAASVCMYTMTPDEHFVIDQHPKHPNVAFAAGFSGHGFKFSPVVGEALADLALTKTTALPIDFLRLGSHRAWPAKEIKLKPGEKAKPEAEVPKTDETPAE